MTEDPLLYAHFQQIGVFIRSRFRCEFQGTQACPLLCSSNSSVIAAGQYSSIAEGITVNCFQQQIKTRNLRRWKSPSCFI